MKLHLDQSAEVSQLHLILSSLMSRSHAGPDKKEQARDTF